MNKVDSRAPTEGVSGLKALGVRELTYRLAFLASSVQPAESRLGLVSIRDDPDAADDGASAFSPDERELIHRMQSDRHVYQKLASSICPTVYGHDEVKPAYLAHALRIPTHAYTYP